MNLAPNSTTTEPELPNKSDSAIITTLLRSLVDKVESGKIHQCQYCPKSFKKKNDLKRHVDAHMQTKNFACARCDYRCVQKHALVSHTQRKHLNPRPKPSSYSIGRHKCQFCTYATNNKTNLTTHSRIHLKLQPFHCPDCSYRTTSKSSLLTHVRKGTHFMVRPAKRPRTAAKAKGRRHDKQ